eukprot:scaffold14553_cov74-Phaeocystis_antarctica.AAC.5
MASWRTASSPPPRCAMSSRTSGPSRAASSASTVEARRCWVYSRCCTLHTAHAHRTLHTAHCTLHTACTLHAPCICAQMSRCWGSSAPR